VELGVDGLKGDSLSPELDINVVHEVHLIPVGHLVMAQTLVDLLEITG
jgi:hypothetical protein